MSDSIKFNNQTKLIGNKALEGSLKRIQKNKYTSCVGCDSVDGYDDNYTDAPDPYQDQDPDNDEVFE